MNEARLCAGFSFVLTTIQSERRIPLVASAGEIMTKLSYDEIIEKIGDHLIFVSEEDRWDDEFRPPATYFILNAMDEAVFFKTRDRNKAQDWSDMLYGKGFYTVRKSMKAQVR